MKSKRILYVSVSVLLLLAFSFSCIAVEQNKFDAIKLSKPELKSGKLLMQALQERKSTRDFSSKELSDSLLSNLLWAGFGINRKDGKRTAPTAMNAQNIIIYVAMKNGVYKYVPEKFQLQPFLNKDIRKELGYQKFLEVAPVVLIFIADFSSSSLSKMSKDDKMFYSAMNTGYISQNLYLYCASENLATVAVGWVKRDAVSKLMKLNKSQKVILVQPVGFPAKK